LIVLSEAVLSEAVLSEAVLVLDCFEYEYHFIEYEYEKKYEQSCAPKSAQVAWEHRFEEFGRGVIFFGEGQFDGGR
jgi:hypothetical protein